MGVVFAKAEGAKCARSWKISKEIGSDKDFPDITPPRRRGGARVADTIRTDSVTEASKMQAGASRFWGPLSRLGALIAVWVFGLDQLSKFWILKIVNLDERPPIQLTPFADLTMAWNEGCPTGCSRLMRR